MRRHLFRLLVGMALVLLGFAVGNVVAIKLTVTAPDFVGDGIYAADAPLPLPSLQALAAGAETDEAIYASVVDYFEQNSETLAQLFSESNPTRLAALYAMYLIHTSHSYGTPPHITTMQEYLTTQVSDCSDTANFQYHVSRALGLETRLIEISGGTHIWTEVNVDGQWEVFDGTVNVWMNRSGYELERGAERHYRAFYTPLLDNTTPRTPTTLSGQRLRIQMMGLGIYWTPLAYLFEVS